MCLLNATVIYIIKEIGNMKSSAILSVRGTRNYGIDLLRIVSMFMVVLLHTLGQGGILKSTVPFGW